MLVVMSAVNDCSFYSPVRKYDYINFRNDVNIFTYVLISFFFVS